MQKSKLNTNKQNPTALMFHDQEGFFQECKDSPKYNPIYIIRHINGVKERERKKTIICIDNKGIDKIRYPFLF